MRKVSESDASRAGAKWGTKFRIGSKAEGMAATLRMLIPKHQAGEEGLSVPFLHAVTRPIPKAFKLRESQICGQILRCAIRDQADSLFIIALQLLREELRIMTFFEIFLQRARYC